MARKILLADDSVTAQNMGRKILADAGYEVVTVNNGSAALKKISELKPDLIVLDVYMPGYSGLEVCQRVKETPDTSRIPILLTVGKLEPFKPEEARRVRADGFIVKPFEASELLSVLTKLEDKIVPRAESSKPGRFARTIAVVEEGRYDRTMAVEEDSSWKNRIVFPSKKKEAEADEVDDSAIYNPVNKDLRTVIERRTAQEATQEDAKVDLGALASQGGLPKDVTPEEIAALAAAAAQIKGTIGVGAENLAAGTSAKARSAEVAVQPPVPALPEAIAPEIRVAEVRADEPKTDESKTGESKPSKIVAPGIAIPEVGRQDKIEAVASEPKQDAIETKADPVADKPREVAAEAGSSPSPADVTAAIAALEPVTYLSANAGSENGLGSHAAADEPVTMAVGTGAASASSTSTSRGPRWTAVATALLPEEGTISLEHEMQKAYAAFAAAEVAYASSAVAVAEPPSPTSSSPVNLANVDPLSVESPSVESPQVSATNLASASTGPASIDSANSDSPNSDSTRIDSTTAGAPASESLVSALAQTAQEHAVPVAMGGSESESAGTTGEKRAAAKSFEIAAAPVSHTQAAVPPASTTAPGAFAEAVAAPVLEAGQAIEAKAQEIASPPTAIVEKPENNLPEVASLSADPVQAEFAEARAIHSEPEVHGHSQEESRQEVVRSEVLRIEDQRSEESKHDLTQAASAEDKPGIEDPNQEEPKSEEPKSLREERETLEAAARAFEEVREAMATTREIPAPAPPTESLAEQISANAPLSQASSEPAPASVAEPVAELTEKIAHKEPAQKESEIAATTAAAWATWRRIRESGDPKSAASAPPAKNSAKNDIDINEESRDEAVKPHDSAAMAVAAGAEKAPDDLSQAAESESGDIANIVDSVLADLRPKIVAEISKKMGKKK